MSAHHTLQYNAPEHVTTNGAQSGGLETLRHEFDERIGEAFNHFRSSTELLRQAADALSEAGVPPRYQLLQALGDCQRRFSRLCVDLSRRAGELGLSIPPVDQFQGITDLYQFLGCESHPSTTMPPEDTRRAEAPIDSADAFSASPGLADIQPVESHELPAFEPAPEPSLVDVGQSPSEPLEASGAPEVASTPDAVEPVQAPPQTPELFGGWYAPAHAVQPVPEPTHEHEIVSEHQHEPDVDHVAEETAPSTDEPLRHHALGVLDRALCLRTRDGSEFAPLTEFLDDVAAIREAIVSSPSDALPVETHRLAEGTHPICGLLTVVEGVAGLTDAQWAELHSTVTEAFGRQMAVSAARGRIVIAS